MAKKFERAIIVGASSGIGAEAARQLAAQGCKVALVARREAEMRTIAETLATPALVFPHDVRSYDEVPALFQQICRELGGLDLFIYTAGVLPRQEADEYDFAQNKRTIETNVLGLMAWGDEAAQRFAAEGGGSLVGISSVAADRGRRGALAYAASKAATDAYLESLRNRVGRSGVRVVTIKPGPVETPMTAGMGKMPFMIAPEAAARRTLTAAAGGPLVVYVPFIWRPIMAALCAIPSAVFRRMNI